MKVRNTTYIKQNHNIYLQRAFALFVWALVFPLCGQMSSQIFAQKAAVAIDSTSIVIGSILRYQIQVESDKGALVVFPEGQTFNPMEMIESFKIDTTDLQTRQTLTKQYALTQFDSGHYTIPQQKIIIGDRTLVTDSLQIEVRDVVVDTTKQKLYDIKPLIGVDVPDDSWNKIIKKYSWWILGALVLIGLVLMLIFRKRKPKKIPEHQLPAYDRALLALGRIDDEHLLDKEAFKEYYSQLSDTARQYLNEEVYDHALESTTEELIEKLEEQKKAGSLNLEKSVIIELKKVLQTADLAKFAKSNPDVGTAKADRNTIEAFIKETKIAIPQPTEEELLLDAAYREELAAKNKRKKIIIAVIAIVGIILMTVVGVIAVYGYDFVRDNVLGHPTKELVEGEWVTSTYGAPPVTISTPKVLERVSEKIPEELSGQVSMTTFAYGSILDMFSVKVNTGVVRGVTEFDLEQVMEGNMKLVEQEGITNMMTKNEEFKTPGGVEGLKVFGSADFPVFGKPDKKIKGNYVALLFNEGEGLQQITLTWKEDDHYAKEMIDRIINSIELTKKEEE